MDRCRSRYLRAADSGRKIVRRSENPHVPEGDLSESSLALVPGQTKAQACEAAEYKTSSAAR